ncbi:MAG TPA: hypothetical protein VH560_00700, partial [Polyangia bacterium]|nr:hypothetical protein [Polyangia bacterium]
MRRPRSSTVRHGRARAGVVVVVFVAALVTGAACRFQPNHPSWIEAQGQARGVRVGAWARGALTIGTDRHLWRYPGEWSRPWLPEGPPQELRALAGSPTAVYGVLADGQVARYQDGAWAPYAGSIGWGASDVSASEDGVVLVVVSGHVRRVDGLELRDTVCPALAAAGVASLGLERAFVLDGDGALYDGGPGRCDHVDAPVRLVRIAANGRRLVAVGADG